MTKNSASVGQKSDTRVHAFQKKGPDHKNVMNVVLYEQKELQQSIRRKVIVAVLAGMTSGILYGAGKSVDETLGMVFALPPAMIGITEATRAILHRIGEFTARYGVTALADQNRRRLSMILSQISAAVPELTEEVRKVERTFSDK